MVRRLSGIEAWVCQRLGSWLQTTGYSTLSLSLRLLYRAVLGHHYRSPAIRQFVRSARRRRPPQRRCCNSVEVVHGIPVSREIYRWRSPRPPLMRRRAPWNTVVFPALCRSSDHSDQFDPASHKPATSPTLGFLECTASSDLLIF